MNVNGKWGNQGGNCHGVKGVITGVIVVTQELIYQGFNKDDVVNYVELYIS